MIIFWGVCPRQSSEGVHKGKSLRNERANRSSNHKANITPKISTVESKRLYLVLQSNWQFGRFLGDTHNP